VLVDLCWGACAFPNDWLRLFLLLVLVLLAITLAGWHFSGGGFKILPPRLFVPPAFFAELLLVSHRNQLQGKIATQGE
jgi:hypothetical protein